MNKKTSLYIGVILGILFAGAALFFVLENDPSFNPWGIFAIDRETGSEPENAGSNRFPLEYKNEALGFSFRHPEGFKITEFSDNSGDIVLAENDSGKDFQIFIQMFDEQGPLTPERILQDAPTMVMGNVRSATLDEVPAVIFESEEPSFGPTFEIWFVWPESPAPQGNYLYQITSKAEFDEELSKIMATFKFN